jgi:hypothetical protein
MGARTSSVSLASSVLAFATLAACGGPSKGQPTTPEGSGGGTGGTGGGTIVAEVTAGAVCDRIFELMGQGCDLVQGYGLSREECEADYTRSLEERGKEARVATETAGHCLLDHPSCGEVTTCFDQMSSGANNGEPQEFRSCGQTEVYAPVGISQADWDRRKGTAVDRFSRAASTKEDPIAVCGIPNEMTWLLAGKCDDGFTINAKWGLGMKVVEGQKVPEQIIFDATNDGTRILSRSDDTTMLVFDPAGGLKEIPIPAAEIILTEARAKRLVTAVQQFIPLFPAGTPLDVEWVLEGERFWIVQARPYVGA